MTATSSPQMGQIHALIAERGCGRSAGRELDVGRDRHTVARFYVSARSSRTTLTSTSGEVSLGAHRPADTPHSACEQECQKGCRMANESSTNTPAQNTATPAAATSRTRRNVGIHIVNQPPC